jgi:hypothetical protein
MKGDFAGLLSDDTGEWDKCSRSDALTLGALSEEESVAMLSAVDQTQYLSDPEEEYGACDEAVLEEIRAATPLMSPIAGSDCDRSLLLAIIKSLKDGLVLKDQRISELEAELNSIKVEQKETLFIYF